MKANAPEKIHISVISSEFGGNKTITCGKCFPNAVEYTRTDVFIEKAAKWLDETLRNTDFYDNEIELMVKEFRKAMEL